MGIFESFLNRLRGNDTPSQMPGAMGGGFGHGMAGDVADIQKMPYRYGDQTGGIQQMPHIYGQQGGQKMAHDYNEDPYIKKTIMEIINTPGYDPASVREAQRQLIRMNQGLPRFPGV